MKPQERLDTATKIVYGVGNVGLQGVVSLISFFLLFFYTDVALIPATVATGALLVAKIWDIINDPLFGWLSDRTRSRFGRRRVYLIFGALPLAAVTYLLFAMPSGLEGVAAFVAVLLSFMLFDTVLTLVAVPYAAMSAELTHDYDERTSLVAYSSMGTVVGFLLGGVAAPAIFGGAESLQQGFRMVGAIFGIIAGVSIAIVAWKVRPRRLGLERPTTLPVVEAVRVTIKNRPFVKLILAFGLVRFGFTMISAALTYFVVRRLLLDEKSVSLILGVMILVVAAFIPFWRRVAMRSSKAYAYAMGLIVTALGMAAIFLVGEGQFGFMMLLTAIVGFGISSHWVMPWAMLPDVVEYDQLVTGQRREGMYFGVYGLVDKIFRTLGLVAVGWVLALFGYQGGEVASGSALLGIRLATGPIPALFLLAAVPILLNYPITRASHAEVRRRLGELE